MMTDIEIAQQCRMHPIADIAATAGIDESYLEQYGRYKAKIDPQLLKDRAERPDGKLILVTAINPTPAGEGKTTTSVGLADGLRKIGKNAVAALREPLSVRCSASRAALPAAAMRRSCPWRTSTSTSPVIFTPSAQPTTCWPPCSITTSSRATPWASTSSRSRGSAAWI